MVHAIGREPVHAADFDAQSLQQALADVVPSEMLSGVFRLRPDGADEAGTASGLQREQGDEIAFVDRDVQLAVHHRSARLDVSDVEEVFVGAAGEFKVQPGPYGRVRAVAAGQERGLASGALEPRHDAAVRFLEVKELRSSLDLHAQLPQPPDQEAFVFILGVDQSVGKRTEARAQPAELDVRGLLSPGPEICRGELEPRRHHLLGETELAIQLESARLQRHRARGRARLGALVDDANPDAEPGQPESEHEAGWTRADDEDLGVHVRKLIPR